MSQTGNLENTQTLNRGGVPKAAYLKARFIEYTW